MDFKQYLNKKLYDFDGKLVLNDGPAGDGAFKNEDLYYIGKKAFELVGEDPHMQNSNIVYDVNKGKLSIVLVANEDIINVDKLNDYYSAFTSLNEYFNHIVECVKDICESVEGHNYVMDVEVEEIMSFDNQKKEQLTITIVKEDVQEPSDELISKDVEDIINSGNFGKQTKTDYIKDFISKEVDKIITNKTSNFGDEE